jgi:hypothetical protein
MPKFSLKPRFSFARMDPVAAHVAHIRHLARPAALEPFLRKRHGFGAQVAKKLAYEVAPFLDQALIFHDASRPAQLRIRPVLQYYTYLNLAVALVLIYQPLGWQGYRKHGVEDITRRLQRISLSSPAIRVRQGALTLFHSIISGARLPGQSLTLRQLFVAIPMVSAELEQAFGLHSLSLRVSGGVRVTSGEADQLAGSYFTFQLSDRDNQPSGDPGLAKFPLNRLYKAMPALHTLYKPQQKRGHTRTFESRQKWSLGNKERAEIFHDSMAMKFINFGAQEIDRTGQANYFWRVAKNCHILPTLTASLLLSFALASLSRYRANVLDRVESSQVNLLLEVFANEADGFVIPAMRNLLYAETLYVQPVGFT